MPSLAPSPSGPHKCLLDAEQTAEETREAATKPKARPFPGGSSLSCCVSVKRSDAGVVSHEGSWTPTG